MKPTSALLIFLCAAGVVALSRPPPRVVVGREVSLLPRKEFLVGIGKAHQSLLVDYLWIQMLQEISRGNSGPELLAVYQLADLITEIDPKFYLVYKFAGLVVPWNLGHEHWVNTEESTRILKKGLGQFPADVSLMMGLLYNHIYFTRDFLAAAQIATQVANKPGVPPYVAQLATRLYSQAGQFDVGISVAEQLRDAAQDEDTRRFFEGRILQLRLEETLRQVDEQIARFHQTEGKRPNTLADLLAVGYISFLPDDPFGGEIIIGPDGRSRSSVESKRLEIKALLQEDAAP